MRDATKVVHFSQQVKTICRQVPFSVTPLIVADVAIWQHVVQSVGGQLLCIIHFGEKIGWHRRFRIFEFIGQHCIVDFRRSVNLIVVQQVCDDIVDVGYPGVRSVLSPHVRTAQVQRCVDGCNVQIRSSKVHPCNIVRQSWNALVQAAGQQQQDRNNQGEVHLHSRVLARKSIPS